MLTRFTVNLYRIIGAMLRWLKSFSPQRISHANGFTLAELIASTSIIIITTGGFAVFVARSAETQRTSTERSVAEKILQGEMEQLYTQPFSGLVSAEKDPTDGTFNPDEDYGQLVQCWENESGAIVQTPSMVNVKNSTPEIKKISLTKTGNEVITKDVKILRKVEWDRGANTYERVTCGNKDIGGLKRITVRVEWETQKGKKEIATLIGYRSVHASPTSSL